MSAWIIVAIIVVLLIAGGLWMNGHDIMRYWKIRNM